MTIYSVGDSIAYGCGGDSRVEKAFATPGMPISKMGNHFDEARAAINPGDTLIVSVAYNSSFGKSDQHSLDTFLKSLPKGVHVRILGLREKWSEAEVHTGDRYGERLAPYTHGRNEALRRIADENGASFVEQSIDISNQLPGGQIHGNYRAMVDAALATPDHNMQHQRTTQALAYQEAGYNGGDVPPPSVQRGSGGRVLS